MILLKPAPVVLALSLCFLAHCEDLMYPQHNEKLRTIISYYWDKYYQCQELYYQEASKNKGVALKMVLPGRSVVLPCAPCHRPFLRRGTYEWKSRTLKNKTHLVEFDDLSEEFDTTEEGHLIIRNAKEEFTGIYQCFEGTNLIKTYIVEVPATVQIALTMKEPDDFPRNLTDLYSVTIHWEAWSECSACNTVGKKYRYGTCLVNYRNRERRALGQMRKDDFELELELFSGNIPCSSQFLKEEMAEKIAETGTTNMVVVEFCKESCSEEKISKKFDVKKVLMKNFKGNAGKMLSSFREMASNIERVVISAKLGSSAIIQCPGWTGDNIPITWRKGRRELIPELVSVETQKRVELDVLGRIIINQTDQSDTGMYSCWQRKRLLGVVSLFTDEGAMKRSSGSLEVIGLLIALCIAINSVYVGWKAWRHRGYY